MSKLVTSIVVALLSFGCSTDERAAAPRDAATAAVGGDGAVARVQGGEGGIAREPAVGSDTPGPLPPGVLRLRPAQVMDPSGFERPVVAATALVPVGWSMQGGYTWDNSDPCLVGDYRLQLSMLAPDGISAVAFVSKPRWIMVKSFLQYDRGPPGRCETANWTTARQFLEALARQSAPDGRILDYAVRDDLIQQQEAMNRMMPLPQSDLLQIQQRADAGQILVAHTVDGREVREMIVALVLFNESRMADVLNPGQVGMITVDALPLSVIYARAPAGQLNVELPGVISKSLRPTADWSNRVFKFSMQKQQREFEAMMQRGRYAADQLRQMQQAHQQRMADMQGSQAQRDRMYDQNALLSDKMQRESVETIRGVETYHEPVDGGVVQLDNSFDHAWRVRDGSYLLTDDPNFRPGLIGLEGQELRRVE